MKSFANAVISKLRTLAAGHVDKLDFHATYSRHVKSLKRQHAPEQALQLAVGGEFRAIGLLELEILKLYGLTESSHLVDVGCGSGRLAQPLSAFSAGRYLGLDIIPELVEHARRIAARPDWEFAVTRGLGIPAPDGAADMVCFFSVFTHLLHEQTYAYLREARRVLKPGGRIVFSFLEFAIPSHWNIFDANVADLGVNANHLNMFLSRDAIRAWAAHLDLEIVAIEDGDRAFVPLSRPITYENGAVAKRFGTLGQSVCALRKPLQSAASSPQAA